MAPGIRQECSAVGQVPTEDFFQRHMPQAPLAPLAPSLAPFSSACRHLLSALRLHFAFPSKPLFTAELPGHTQFLVFPLTTKRHWQTPQNILANASYMLFKY